MDVEVRAALFRRTRGYCDWCGLPMLEEEMAAHHRKRRAQGGTWALSNLTGAHHHCHNLARYSIHHRVAHARAQGFLLSGADNPPDVPLLLHGARLVTLHDDGTVTELPEES